MLKLRNRSTRVLVRVLGASMMIIMMGTHQLVVAVPSSTTGTHNHNLRLEWLDSSRLKRHRGRGQRTQRRPRGRQLWWNHRQQDSGKLTTTTVTTVTTTATRKPTPSPTTTVPTAAPSPTPTTAAPTVEPSSTTSGGSFEEGIAKNPWRRMLLRWSLFIPVISFSIMAWAVRKSTRRCVCCADWLIDDAVPEEIVVTRKKPRSRDDDVIDNDDDGSDHSALGQRDADVELVPVQTIRSYPEHWTDPGVDPLLRNVPFDESRYHNSGSSTSLDDGILLEHEYRRMKE